MSAGAAAAMLEPVDAATHASLDVLGRHHHHLAEASRRAAPGSDLRKDLRVRLTALERQFDRVLATHVPDLEDRDAWRRWLHGGRLERWPFVVPRPLVVFRGRSWAGSTLALNRLDDGELEVILDGVLVDRIGRSAELDSTTAPVTFRFRGVDYDEEFHAGADAIAAVGAHVGQPEREPPWEDAPELFEDGLIDLAFELTPRGRRALTRPAVAAAAS